MEIKIENGGRLEEKDNLKTSTYLIIGYINLVNSIIEIANLVDWKNITYNLIQFSPRLYIIKSL